MSLRKQMGKPMDVLRWQHIRDGDILQMRTLSDLYGLVQDMRRLGEAIGRPYVVEIVAREMDNQPRLAVVLLLKDKVGNWVMPQPEDIAGH